MRIPAPSRLTLALAVLALLPTSLVAQSGAVRGDVNGDGRIDAIDARLVMDHVAGRALPPGVQIAPAGDADGNGRITALDAAVIRAYAAGRDMSRFPVGRRVADDPTARFTELTCRAAVSSRAVVCSGAAGEPALGARGDVIVGGQNLYVVMQSQNVQVLADTFSFEARVRNLVPQPMGLDATGSVDPNGVRIFFASGPTVTSGTGSANVLNEDGVDAFTSGGQPYFKYGVLGGDGRLDQGEDSEWKNWRIQLVGSVNTFEFKVYVSAPMEYPQGWVDIYPRAALDSIGPERVPGDTMLVGETLQLSDSVRNAVGRALTGETTTWSSTGSEATVSPAGLVSAAAEGVDSIIATSTTRTGRLFIRVTQLNADSSAISGGGSVMAGDSAQVSLQLKDGLGRNFSGTATVTISSTFGAVGTVSSAGSGVYTAWIKSNTTGSGMATGTVNGSPIGDSVAVSWTPGAAAQVVKIEPLLLDTVIVGDSVLPRPRVEVRDALGNAVGAGVAVSFTPSTGSSVVGGSQTTNASGQATVGKWTIGSGLDSLTVTAGTGSAVFEMYGNSNPVAARDSIDGVGNVTITGTGLLGNDSDAEGHTLSITPIVGGTTAGGGTISITAAGGVTYTSSPTFTGVDSATYTLNDAAGGSSTGRLVIRIPKRMWFVQGGAAGSNQGTQANPATSFTPVATNSAAVDSIFVAASGTAVTNGITLKSGQALLGAGLATGTITRGFTGSANMTLDVVTLLTTGAAPAINPAAGNAVTLTPAGTGATVRGLAITTASGAGISGGNFGTLALGNSELTLNATGGAALDLTNGTVNGTVTSASATGGGGGLILSGLSGTLLISGGRIFNATGTGININFGNLNFTYAGRVVQAVNSTGISVASTLGGTVNFTGANDTLSTQTGRGIVVQDNAAGTVVNFSGGGMVITTTTAFGIDANRAGADGGTISITGAGNKVTTQTGTALHLRRMAVGAGGIQLDSAKVTTGAASGFAAVQLDSATSGGSIAITAGDLTGVAGAPVILVRGGSVNATYGGNATQTANNALVSVTGGHTGTLSFSGALSASSGTGLQFDNADGTYNFNTASGTTTLNGGDAGIDIINGSSGDFTFGRTASPGSFAITHSHVGNQAFFVDGGAPAVIYNGNITKASRGWVADIFNTTGDSVVFQAGTLNGAGSRGITFNNADGVSRFLGTTTLSGDSARINVQGGSSGAITFSTGASVTNPAATVAGVNISNGSASASFTYNGTISSNNGRPLQVANVNGGTVTFTGRITGAGFGILVNNNQGGAVINLGSSRKQLTMTGTNPAVVLTSNGAGAGATVQSGDSLQISTDDGNGYDANGGGTVVVMGGANTVTSTGGIAINVQNTTIGASGVTFRSVDATGGSNGIFLQNTGTSGGLTIAGNSSGNCGGSKTLGPTIADCTGGTIQSTTGADNTSAGVGVYLENTSRVSLTRVRLMSHPNHAIKMTGVTGFTANNMYITGINGSNGTYDEGGIWVSNLGGTAADNTNASITYSTIEGAFEHNFWMVNSSGTLERLRFNQVTVGANALASGDKGVAVEVTGGTTNVTVDSSRFTAAAGDMFNFTVQGTGAGDVVLSNNTFHNTHGNIVSGGGGVGVNAGGSGDMTYSITNNSFRGAKGAALVVGKLFGGAPGNGTASGTIASNTIGVTGMTSSGSSEGSGIYLSLLAQGSHTSLIQNNVIRQYRNYGIYLFVGGSSETTTGLTHNGSYNVTLRGNTVAEPDNLFSFPQYGVHLRLGTNAGDEYQTCVDLGHATDAAQRNTLDQGGGTSGMSIGEDVFLWPRFDTTIRLPGYGGGATDNTAVTNYLTSRNNNPGTTQVLLLRQNVAGWSGGGGCTLP